MILDIIIHSPVHITIKEQATIMGFPDKGSHIETDYILMTIGDKIVWVKKQSYEDLLLDCLSKDEQTQVNLALNKYYADF